MGTSYSGRIFNVGDVVYFTKWATSYNGPYNSMSGTLGTLHGTVKTLMSSSYAFPIMINKVSGSNYSSSYDFALKPTDVTKGYQVTVTYNKNYSGASSGGTQTGYVGASLTGTASRAGYTFAGWYTSNGSKVTTIPANPATYYAHWTGNTYYVVFNGNGATGGSTAKETFTYGTAKALTANGFTKTGYHFNDWATNSSGSGNHYSNKQSVNNLTSTNKGTVNLYAQWTANSYTVKFNGNGATSGSTADQSHTYGTSKALRANGFTKTGYKFLGWSKTKSATSATYTNQQSVKNLTSTNGGTVTLYAIWQLQYVAPSITNISAIRSNSSGTANDVGEYLHLTWTIKANTTVSSSNKISTVAIKYKARSETSYTTLATLSPNVATYSTPYTSSSASFNIDTAYDIRIEVTDSYGTSVGMSAPQAKATTFLSKAFFTMDFSAGDSNVDGGQGVGIGLPAPVQGLDIGMRTIFYNQSAVTNESSESQNSTQGGTFLQARVTGVSALSGDNFRALMGVNSSANSAGIWIADHGAVTSGYWLIREYYNSGAPYIQIGDSQISDIRLMGHNSSIGAMISDDGTKSLSSSTTLTKIADCGTLPVGSWIIFGMASFPDSATGTRGAAFYVNGTRSGVGYATSASGAGVRVLSFSSPYRVVSSGGATIEIYARQNSGSSMTVTWYYRAMRIA